MVQSAFPRPTDFSEEVSGLMYGYYFSAGAIPQRKSAAALVTLAQQPSTDQGFIWLHINLNHAAAGRWLRQHFLPDDDFLDEINATSSRTRIALQGDALFTVLNDVRLEHQGSQTENATLWTWCRRGILITARYKPVSMIEKMVATLPDLAFTRAEEMLFWLLEIQENCLESIIRHASYDVYQIEERLFNSAMRHNRTILSKIRRSLLRVQSLLAPEPAALFRLLNRPPEWLAEQQTRELREFSEEFSVGLNDLGNLMERIRLLQEEAGAQLMEQNNRTLYLLTIITVLALPINIVAGLFGMNVGGIPLASDHHGFFHLVALVVLFTLLACLWVYRRSR